MPSWPTLPGPSCGGRWPTSRLEIAAAEHAQREAKKKARKELREARHKQHKDKVDAKVAELKAKLPGHKQVAGTRS